MWAGVKRLERETGEMNHNFIHRWYIDFCKYVARFWKENKIIYIYILFLKKIEEIIIYRISNIEINEKIQIYIL